MTAPTIAITKMMLQIILVYASVLMILFIIARLFIARSTKNKALAHTVLIKKPICKSPIPFYDTIIEHKINFVKNFLHILAKL